LSPQWWGLLDNPTPCARGEQFQFSLCPAVSPVKPRERPGFVRLADRGWVCHITRFVVGLRAARGSCSAVQIWPAIDLRGGKCVRLRQGDFGHETVFGDDPAAMARYWISQGAECLHLVDLDGARTGSPANLPSIAAIVQAVDVPCELGGGVRPAGGGHASDSPARLVWPSVPTVSRETGVGN
jgi:Histidine biosynthesis protein